MDNSHFETLWERAEQFHKDASPDASVAQILDELQLKISLYKAVDTNNLPLDEAIKAKSHVFGEVLLSLTRLSLIDQINTYEALLLALQQRQVEHLDKKHPI
jgi:hypothetical protein